MSCGASSILTREVWGAFLWISGGLIFRSANRTGVLRPLLDYYQAWWSSVAGFAFIGIVSSQRPHEPLALTIARPSADARPSCVGG